MSAINSKVILAVAVLITAVACNSEQFDPNTANTIIVEGYLYAHEPVNNIKLGKLIAFTDTSNQDLAINDADIAIYWNDQEFDLVSSPGDSGYYHYSGNDLEIIEGNTYEIRVGYEEQIVNAFTTVPKAPGSLNISDTIIEVSPITSIDDLFNRTNEELELSWDNSEGEYYYILVENMEIDPEEIDQTDFEFPGGQDANFQFRTSPTNLDSYNINIGQLTQYGKYRVKIYKVNQEYVDLYETAEQDSRNFTEPLNNINNGLGIFTSFNSDSVFFNVVKSN